ncbi:hypothetical protein BG004_006222 [Podila humilis]|nr:hypothetical protein BG004_006222 [Podila humilis]
MAYQQPHVTFKTGSVPSTIAATFGQITPTCQNLANVVQTDYTLPRPPSHNMDPPVSHGVIRKEKEPLPPIQCVCAPRTTTLPSIHSEPISLSSLTLSPKRLSAKPINSLVFDARNMSPWNLDSPFNEPSMNRSSTLRSLRSPDTSTCPMNVRSYAEMTPPPCPVTFSTPPKAMERSFGFDPAGPSSMIAAAPLCTYPVVTMPGREFALTPSPLMNSVRRPAAPPVVVPPIRSATIDLTSSPNSAASTSPSSPTISSYMSDIDVAAEQQEPQSITSLPLSAAEFAAIVTKLKEASQTLKRQQSRLQTLVTIRQDKVTMLKQEHSSQIDPKVNKHAEQRANTLTTHLELQLTYVERLLTRARVHSAAPNLGQTLRSGCEMVCDAVIKGEQQLTEYLELVNNTLTHPEAVRHLEFQKPQYFTYPLGKVIMMHPGFDVCRQFKNEKCSFAYPDKVCISDNDLVSKKSEMQQHHIYAVDKPVAYYKCAMMHVAPVEGFSLSNPEVIEKMNMIHIGRKLYEEHTSKTTKKRRSSSSAPTNSTSLTSLTSSEVPMSSASCSTSELQLSDSEAPCGGTTPAKPVQVVVKRIVVNLKRSQAEAAAATTAPELCRLLNSKDTM